ncbi:DUF1778 domain-containing protein [Pseudomonas sp. CBZ-4]|uniref:type II toxin-antitoxin system TacA family antitoxin n=1 Tax=Pseudomonas sp. CBZ-4 TaxID=1163065 RepID=UPI000A2EDE7B|nr:DUF1778 domain-containing protein [Pseudomonas sp. CBZ-4]
MMDKSRSHSLRIQLRISSQQSLVLGRAAKLANKSLHNFILDSACQVATDTLLCPRLRRHDGDQAQSFIALLDRAPQDNPGLQDLMERTVPWSR